MQSLGPEADEALCFPTDSVFDDADEDPHFAVLTAGQQPALEWLMSSGTITRATEVVGVNRQTVILPFGLPRRHETGRRWFPFSL
jgi:hypothetical protein